MLIEPSERMYIDLPSTAERMLIGGARSSEPVRGLTHGFYKYPARFSPDFAKAAIEAFTRPGDLCLDPHVGGGTTLVEAFASGRNSVGVDVSTLSQFVATVKTTTYTCSELEALVDWLDRALTSINMRRVSFEIEGYAELGYYKHLKHPARWRLRKAIEQAVWSAILLRNSRLEAFARCAVLRTAQWAMDGRFRKVGVRAFRTQLAETTADMIAGARALAEAVEGNGGSPTVQILNRSAAGLEDDERLAGMTTPRLVLTSPPYPGVHVLYHRWQVDGRKEAPLPFMIAGKLDGAGSSFYTMGSRAGRGLTDYFANVRATMASIARLADDRTTFIQMVAFSDPPRQLPVYLEAMRAAGLEERFLRSLEGEADGRLWRSVPGRRWYSDQRGATPGSREVVLIHRLSSTAREAPVVVATVPLPTTAATRRDDCQMGSANDGMDGRR